MVQCRRFGFTLIEIMIVLVIIGILALAILPNVVGSDRPARIVTTKSNLAALRTALQLFRAKENRYPKDDLSDLITETYNDQGKQIHYIRVMPKELISDPNGRNTVTNTLGTGGGWYYSVTTAEIRVNYNKDLDQDWGLDADYPDKNPSGW